MNKELHIISFDIPYPADYGGVIDVFYKIKALASCGVSIHLHCFSYGRKQSEVLHQLCKSVHYYERKSSKAHLFNGLPYIVLSRQSDELKKNLLSLDAPVLMEGMHSTFYLNDSEFANRKMYVRMHNIEHDYYSNLAKVESNIFKRYYFYNESGKLKKYENNLHKAMGVAAISPADTAYLQQEFKNVKYIPAFHPNEEVTSQPGKGDYYFYHGNLSVGENNEAALYLVNKIFDDLDDELIIAGNKPTEELRKAVIAKKNVRLIEHLSPSEIHNFIANAHCNILPTFQATGIKLKLLSSLFAGRFCIVNTPMVAQTGLESLCIIADETIEMKERIIATSRKKFNANEIEKRTDILLQNFDNEKNAELLSQFIFSHQ